MKFKDLAQELMLQGFRAYHIKDSSLLGKGDNLKRMAIRKGVEVIVYEGKDIVFVKDSKPTDNE